MPKVKGTFVAARPRKIVTRRGETQSYQVAYIPQGDENDFPAVLNVAVDVYGQLAAKTAGEAIEMTTIETPPYGDALAVAVL